MLLPDVAETANRVETEQRQDATKIIMRKVWYHQIWIQNYLGFIVSDLIYIPIVQNPLDILSCSTILLFITLAFFLKLFKDQVFWGCHKLLKSFFLLVLPLIVALSEYLTFFFIKQKIENRKQKNRKKYYQKKTIFVKPNYFKKQHSSSLFLLT